MTIPSFDAAETECVKNCLFKFNAVERLMIEKMRQVMEGMIAGDPGLKKAFTAKAAEDSKTHEWLGSRLLFIIKSYS